MIIHSLMEILTKIRIVEKLQTWHITICIAEKYTQLLSNMKSYVCNNVVLPFCALLNIEQLKGRLCLKTGPCEVVAIVS